ncbi:hypothetical protein FB45DRAFT_1005647 [Roridomyces roridus]|uniref:Cyanamide hydratase n=1 Tax=Roridomyces roridus TaxID=1738132 RepID=A0AAD7BM89_9AGAR|nr:hypothetical protein FB45DRAFT_1005647 [Roridomyces roridus]
MAFPKTFDAFIPCNLTQFLSLTKFKPDYVSLETLRSIPLGAASSTSFSYAEKLTPPDVFIHCTRCYYFALAFLYNGFPSNTPGVPQITLEELTQRLYLTCILHDIGLTTTEEGSEHPASKMSFELHGGIMAYEHLQASMDSARLGDIVQSIMLHTSQWNEGNVSAVTQLITLSAFLILEDRAARGIYCACGRVVVKSV